MTQKEIFRWNEYISNNRPTFPGVVQFGLLSVLFGVYVFLVVWMGGKQTMEVKSGCKGKSIKLPLVKDSLPVSPQNTTSTIQSQTSLQNNKQTTLLIYDYNAAPHTQHRLSFNGCSHPCALTKDTTTAALLYINAGQLSSRTIVPSRRKKHQIWLLYSREPPTFPRFDYLNRSDLKGQINWTRSIFSDATFPLSYGMLQKWDPVERDFDAIYESKSHSVAWFVGHCDTQSRRGEYVTRMTSHIDVHIYGICGNMTCGERGYNMGGFKNKCLKMLSSKYKFYLAFENSFCENYVTEKFFNLFRSDINVDVIPVVRGGADYKRLFDPMTFVDAADFPSPEDLAVFLSQLARDKHRYVAMLKRKSRYTVGRPSEKFECTMCRSLHLQDIPQHSYEDIYSFWKRPDRCHEPPDLGGG